MELNLEPLVSLREKSLSNGTTEGTSRNQRSFLCEFLEMTFYPRESCDDGLTCQFIDEVCFLPCLNNNSIQNP